MQLRSLQITIYVGALTLIACGSSNSGNSDPFESATQEPNVKPDASTVASSGSSGGSTGNSSGSTSSGGSDTTGVNGSCKQDSDCSNGCGDSSVCCCETSSSTCYSPPSGQCGSGNGDSGSTGDDSGGDDSGDNNQPI